MKPLLSATLIAKNEVHNVVQCFDSIWPHVDQVVLVDTGSSDKTVARAQRYALAQGEPDKLIVGSFEWCDDFAAARNHADSLATGEWLVWLDMDDTIEGLDALRGYAAGAAADVIGFFCAYSYAQDAHGNTISELWRERVVRNVGIPWEGRLHEHKIFTQGSIVKVDPNVARWVHHRDHEVRTGERNLRILERWDREQPDTARVVQSLAMEYMGEGRHKDASEAFLRYLSLPGEPGDRRAQAFRHGAVMLLLQENPQAAQALAFRALQETGWLWADTHLTLAECAQTLDKPQEALIHAQTAMQIGQPDTLLIINPLQYTAHPRALMAVCFAMLGRFEDALRHAGEALQVAPDYPLAAEHVPAWRAALKRQHTVGTWLASVDVLIEAGEPLKARTLLSQAPFYVTDEEALVRKRAEVSRLITERLGAVLAPDESADAFVKRFTAGVAA